MNFKILNIFFLLLCYSYASKAQKKQLLELIPSQERILNTTPYTSNNLGNPKLVEENGKSYLVWLDYTNQVIIKFDLEANKVAAALPIDELRKARFVNAPLLYNASYENDSSIFVVLNPTLTTRRYFHDSLLYQTKIFNPKQFKVLRFDHPLFYRIDNSKIEDFKFLTVGLNIGEQYPILESKLYLPLNGTTRITPGDSAFNLRKIHSLGYFDLSISPPKLNLVNLYFPTCASKYDLGSHYRFSFLRPTANNMGLLVSFPYTSKVYYLMSNGVLKDSFNLASMLFSEVVVAEEFGKRYQQVPQNLIYKLIDSLEFRFNDFCPATQNPYTKEYVRVVKYGSTNDNVALELKQEDNFIRGLIIADSSLKTVSEGIIPPGLSPVRFMVMEKDQYCFLNKTKTDAYSNSLVLSCYKVKPKKGTAEDLRKQLIKIENETAEKREVGLIPYLKSQKIQIDKGLYLIIPYHSSCPSCLDKVANYCASQQKLWENKQIKIIFIDGTKNEILNLFNKYKIDKDLPNIFIDDKKNYIKYFNQWINPRVMIFDNNKIEMDKILNPAEIPSLPNIIDKYLSQ